jgi:DNA polymerase III delta prime subunit
MDLSDYIPTDHTMLFGASPQKWAKVLESKVAGLKEAGTGKMRVLLIGPPGCGKTVTANFLAKNLVDCDIAIRRSNGAGVSAELVREASLEARCASLFSSFRVWLINEIDCMNHVAQDLMLSFMDELPDRYAVIGTSNLDIDQITKRFQSRFQQMEFKPPSAKEVSIGLQGLGVPAKIADAITKHTSGDVRASLLDAQTWIDSKNAK